MRKYRNMVLSVFMCGSLFLQSCYDDKGNYDYSDIGQVVIEQPNDVPESSASKSAMQDDSLVVVPVLKLTNVAEAELEFVWDMAPANTKNPQFTELARTRDLRVICRAEANKYDLRFQVKDKNTGVSTYAYYSLVVSSVTTRCLLLLCKADGANQFDISSCPIQASRGVVGKDLYSARNGGLLTDVQKLVYWNNIRGEQFLWGLQQNGGVTLSAFDLTYHGDATEWFFETPEVIQPMNIYGDVDGNDYFFLSAGGLYYLDNALTPPFKARMREKIDDLDYRVKAAANVSVRKKRRYAFWDELNGRFLQWDYNKKALSGFTAPDLVANPKSFDPNKMQGYTPIFLGDGIDKISYNLFLGPDGHVHLFCFTGTGSNILPGEHRVLDDAIGLQNADCIWAHRRHNMIYYAIDNVIYVFEPASPIGAHREVYRDEDTQMRFIELFSYDSYETKLYAAGNSGGKGYVYRLYLESSGDLTEPTLSQPDVVEKEGPFREIVDMEYLLKDY